MTDSAHTPTRRWQCFGWRRLAASITMLALASGWCAGVAGADGDPASDVLATQTLFLPQDAGVSAQQQAQLTALMQTARHSGYQIRVAVIASETDLGSITELWRQPQNYAHFLGVELSLMYRGPLLVVMPNGYGLYRAAGPRATEPSPLASAQAPGPGADLGTATLTAIQRLAAASGHALALPNTSPASSPAVNNTISWLVFAIGSALIAIAWSASLRARPLRHPDDETTISAT